MKKLIVLTAVILAVLLGGRTSTASAHTLSHSEKMQAKKTYYHASGYIKAIGKNARRTIYHPDPRVSDKWHNALHYLISVRHRAWIKLHPPAQRISAQEWLVKAFICIHGYEGAWTANTGNGYYGGMQMDYSFMRTYGSDYMRQWGTADRWPAWAQINASVRAHNAGRGFLPWPNTARACGLL